MIGNRRYLVLNKPPLSRIGYGGVDKSNGALIFAKKKQKQDRGWRPVCKIGRSKDGLGRLRSRQFGRPHAALQGGARGLYEPNEDIGRERAFGSRLLQTALGKLSRFASNRSDASFILANCIFAA